METSGERRPRQQYQRAQGQDCRMRDERTNGDEVRQLLAGWWARLRLLLGASSCGRVPRSLGESCVTGSKRPALGSHASSLLISEQEDAGSKSRASQSPLWPLSTTQRRVKRWVLVDLAQPMSIGPMRTRARRASESRKRTAEALRLAAVRVQVQTRDLCAPAVPSVLAGPCVVHVMMYLSEDATLALSIQNCDGPKRQGLRVAQL
jgi:hypothetical protein